MALLQTLTDDFASGSRDAAKWNLSAGSATIAQTGGRMEVTLPTAGNSGSRAYVSVNNYDLTESYSLVEVPTVPSTVGDNATYLILKSSLTGGNWFGISIETFDGGAKTIKFNRWSSGSLSTTSITYDPVAHKYIRIRHSGSNILWETSPDGVTWTTRRSLATPWAITSMGVTLGATKDSNTGSPGIAAFDNFNLPPVAQSAGFMALL